MFTRAGRRGRPSVREDRRLWLGTDAASFSCRQDRPPTEGLSDGSDPCPALPPRQPASTVACLQV